MTDRWRATRTMTETAKLQRKQPTQAEHAMWAVLRPLRNTGYAFRRQVPMGRFVLDFYCPTAKLAIEIDGSIHDIEQISEADHARQAYLETDHGVTFLRFSNAEVLQSPSSIRNQILHKIENLQNNPH